MLSQRLREFHWLPSLLRTGASPPAWWRCSELTDGRDPVVSAAKLIALRGEHQAEQAGAPGPRRGATGS